MTAILENDSVRLYNFWEDVRETVEEMHEYLMGQNRVAVLEANPVTEQTWFHEFDNVHIARAYMDAMGECTDYPTCSQWFVVGADIVA
jgi:hypothetical protein